MLKQRGKATTGTGMEEPTATRAAKSDNSQQKNCSQKNAANRGRGVARSIVMKMNYLYCTVEAMRPHVIIVTESWAHSDLLNEQFHTPGYILFQNDCEEERCKLSDLKATEFTPRTASLEKVW
jgi:hypothetical protein